MFGVAIGYALVKVIAMTIGTFLLSLFLFATVVFILMMKIKGKKGGF